MSENIENGSGNVENVDIVNVFPEGVTTADIMKNPQLVAAVQAKLDGLMGVGTGFMESLPKSVIRRINALKNIQVECAKLEGKFYEEAHLLEMKYAELFKPLYNKRNLIVNAQHEPSEEEANWVEPGEDEDEEKEENAEEEEAKSEEEKLAADVLKKLSMNEDTKGIPEFWLTAMKNVELLSDMIQIHDEDILKHLTDVKLIFTGKDNKDDSDMGFVLEFTFSENEHFTNTALTKTYKMKSDPDEEDPFAFEGPDIVSCSGCKIDWKDDKNVTQKQVKKKQKHKGRGQTRIVTKTVQNDSFFNFFEPPEVPEEMDEDDMDEETEAILGADFEIGHFFRERLIPKAVLFYTGEAIEDESEDEDESYDEDDDEDADDDDDEDNEENDPDFKPPEGDKPQECKQQ
jgi:nucleosome assembly protein 1-like 1